MRASKVTFSSEATTSSSKLGTPLVLNTWAMWGSSGPGSLTQSCWEDSSLGRGRVCSCKHSLPNSTLADGRSWGSLGRVTVLQGQGVVMWLPVHCLRAHSHRGSCLPVVARQTHASPRLCFAARGEARVGKPEPRQWLPSSWAFLFSLPSLVLVSQEATPLGVLVCFHSKSICYKLCAK